MGGTSWEDPEYPGILSIPDTADLRGMVGGLVGRIPSILGY